MNLLETIKSHEQDFSKSEKKVYDFIINNPNYIEKYTISKIAASSGTSTSAVLRFCQVLGFSGYKDFRFEMINYIHENHINLDNNDLFQQFASDYIKTMNQFTNIERVVIDHLIECLKNKKPIYISGIFYSSLPAKALSISLQDLGILSHLACDYMEISHLYNTMKEDATLIHFSISGESIHSSPLLTDSFANLPENSFLITMSPNCKASSFRHIISLPGRPLNRKSVVDLQSIPLIFVEILINLLHHSY